MKSLLTKKLSNHVVQQLIESITEPANNVYYLTASKHTPYSGGDDTIPVPNDTVFEIENRFYEELLFGKKITASDMIRMVPRHDWVSGTTYAQYDDTDSSLFNKNFYAAVNAGSYYYVYKVLENNNGNASTVQPSSTSESACNFVTTGDGYKWKLMYRISEADFNKFATADYMPVQTSANVAGNTVSGALDVIKVTYPGSGYVSTLAGQFAADDIRDAIPTTTGSATTYRLNANAASNSNFYVGSSLYISSGTGAGQLRSIVAYNSTTRVITVNTAFTTAPTTDSNYLVAPNVTISGDGSGAAAYAIVASNTTVNNYIQKVQIINRGSGYTYASATVVGNTGGTANTATARVIIPPGAGHGSDATLELGSSQLGISVSFNNNESGYVTTLNDYRQVGILKDPLFKTVTLTLGDENGTFTSSEKVHQVIYKKLTGVVSTSLTSNVVTGVATDFSNSLVAGDKVIIFDTTTGTQCFRTITAVTNSTSLSLNSNSAFTTSFATLAHATILASGTKTGNSSPYLTIGNTEPKFITGKRIIGESSGAFANVTAINVQEKNYNSWLTFDNRTRIVYTANTNTFTPDSVVYQTDTALSNAYFHSANATYVFLSSEKGPINADPSTPLKEVGSGVVFTLGSVKYVPDIQKGSGELLYIENNNPISRSNSQSETIRLVLNF